jgi:hypothetical protein
MRRFACVCCAVLVLANCAGSDEQPEVAADSLPLTPAPAATAISLADVAGKWNIEVMPENSDSVVLRYVLNASADTAAWSSQFPDRPDPVKVHVVAVAGDSIVTHAGPYPSALRKGVTVTTDGVFRLEGGTMVGRNVAHYSGGPDTVLVLRSRGTRAQ